MKTWRDIEQLADRDTLQNLIEQEGTPTRIARRLGCSLTSVKSSMTHHGLQTKKYKLGEEIRKKLDL